jgi:uncharacterized protein YgbK (DUF1537 family)
VPLSQSGGPVVAVLDDDPTGVQTISGVRVLLDWGTERVRRALSSAHSVHLLTNSRALVGEDARAIVASAATAVISTGAPATIVLRGDSTLRGHVLEEYLGVRDARGAARFPPLVLAPALPTAGRMTVGGIQYLERDGTRAPVHTTEYARDGPFAYTSSRLLVWAEERSGGLFAADRGVEVDIETLRLRGPDALVEAIGGASSAPVPTAVSVDSETPNDVEIAAEGVRRARAASKDFVVRCGPALAGALGHATAAAPAQLPAADRVLVVCGSYVAQSERQLARLSARFPEAVVGVDPFTLASPGKDRFTEITRRLQRLLGDSALAILAVAGPRPEGISDLPGGMRVAQGIAALVASVKRLDALVVIKGGVTSAVAIKDGLGALEADIIGPVLPGVALWQVVEPDPFQVLVVPGNVGDDELLVTLVERITGAAV